MASLSASRAEAVGLELHRGVAALADEWDALADACDATPFVRPGWVGAWWDAFGRGDLLVLALRRDGRLAAVLPMRRVVGGIASPTNWHTPEFAPVAADAEALDELAQRLFARPHRRIDVGFLEGGGAARAAIERAARGARLVHVRTLARSPYVATDVGEDDYLARLPKGRRKSMRRQRRRLEEAGEVEFRMDDGSGGVDEPLAEAFRIEASGWKGRDGTAILSRAATQRFYTDVVHWAAERGWLRLSSLRLDGRGIAFDLSVEHGGACYSLKAGYDAQAAALGPGIQLLHELVLWAVHGDVATLELLGGEEDYKRDWATGHRELVLFQAFSRTPAGRAAQLAAVRGRPAAKAVRSAARKVLP